MSEDIMYGNPSDILKYIKELEAQLAKAEKVIEFYGDKDNYQPRSSHAIPEIVIDSGKTAREYFKDKEGE